MQSPRGTDSWKLKKTKSTIRTTLAQKTAIQEGIEAIAKYLKTIDAENLLDLQVIQNSKYMYNHNKRETTKFKFQ